jgi:hypothetical protein
MADQSSNQQQQQPPPPQQLPHDGLAALPQDLPDPSNNFMSVDAMSAMPVMPAMFPDPNSVVDPSTGGLPLANPLMPMLLPNGAVAPDVQPAGISAGEGVTVESETRRTSRLTSSR